jgi:hypothetical protein
MKPVKKTQSWLVQDPRSILKGVYLVVNQTKNQVSQSQCL